MTSDQFVWLCPSCGRHVPRRVDECRCGYRQPPPELVIADAQAATPSGQPGQRGPLLVAVGVLLGLGLAAVALRPFRSAPVSPNVAVQLAPDTAATVPDSPPALPDPVPPDPSPDDIRTFSLGSAAGTAQPSDVSSPLPASLEDVIARTVPAVVSIQAGQARGTGFFIRPDYVLTNAHVVEGQTSVQLLTGETTYAARVTGISTTTDLAVLQVYNANPRQATLRLASVKGVRVGQEVVAIGFALGVLSNTVTRGIVSAIRDTGSVTLIQTDAAINPGNSGGPLVDRTGLVIGVNSMRVGSARGGGEGLAFAVAIDHAAPLLSGRAPLAGATPLQDLNRLMGGASASEQMRGRGEEVYRKALEGAGRSGAELDASWDRYATSCVSSAARTGDRPWFAVLEPNGIRIAATSAYDCESWLRIMRTGADSIRAELAKAAEFARRQGVFPGVMRDLRREHRMEWPGWER